MAPRSRAGMLRCTAISSLVFLGVGIAVIAVGILVPAQVSKQLRAGILETIIWKPDSPPATDARFRNNTGPGAPPDLFRVWLFNITNVEEVRAGGLPVLEQVGPYVHRAYHEKHDVVWDNNGRVYYKDYTHYELDLNLTEADPSANITTFNLALLGVLGNLHGSVSPQYRPFVDVLMQAIASYEGEPGSQGVFTSKPAMELLWGYEDKLLQLLNALLPPGTLQDGAKVRLLRNTSSLEEALARKHTIVNTGLHNLEHIWNTEADQGRRVVSSWPCDPELVHGSDASQFRPGLQPSDDIQVFIADLFQAKRLVVNTTVKLHGVDLLRFWLDPAQSEPNPCRNQELRGLMNITTPQAVGFDNASHVTGPYVFVSMPMFCGADERLALESGLKCDMASHMTWVDVEPITGITLRAYKRLMMSSRVGDLGVVLDPQVRHNLTIPMFWAEEAVAATPELAQTFKGQVYRAQWVVQHLAKLCWIGGGSLMLLGIILAVLTVELAADPESWSGQGQANASLLAVARRMLTEGSVAGGMDAGAGSSRRQTVGAAGSRSSGGGAGTSQRGAGGLQEPLLQPEGRGQEHGEIVES